MEGIMRFRHNVMDVNSITAFEQIRGGVNKNCKDVYFVRAVGASAALVRDVEQMDRDMVTRMQDGYVVYRRVSGLPGLANPDVAADYEKAYLAWAQGNREAIHTKVFGDKVKYGCLLADAVQTVLRLYAAGRTVSASMEKNFVVKLLFWHDSMLSGLRFDWEKQQSVKFVLSNITKKQEYLFAYFLTLLGIDVLLLQCEADISKQEEALGLSQKVDLGSFRKVALPEYRRDEIEKSLSKGQKERCLLDSAGRSADCPSAVQREEPPGTGAGQKTGQSKVGARQQDYRPKISIAQTKKKTAASQEKSFEQLALLASSVVLIAIHNTDGDIVGTGSGIMIGKDGYILTNSHVASGGAFYSIRIEEDEKVYRTDELIKYHSVLDLAVLRIDRRLQPLSVYQGNQKLVRGQKVVAIGSPLGLFNSVSDGIIAGFRVIDGVDMIQFTAPISHGSSGGAVLNMFGEVIGISTAGFDDGQNINLAVGYACINQFIRGFV